MLNLFAKKEATPKKAIVKMIAVRMHANWCEYSRVMVPMYEDLKNRFDGKEVLFVTLDYTNNTSKYQSDLLAVALGIDEAVGKHLETGAILLIGYDAKVPFAKLTTKVKFKDMVDTISSRLDENFILKSKKKKEVQNKS